MKPKPKCQPTETIEDTKVYLSRDDYQIHYINCEIFIEEDLKELDTLKFTQCTFEPFEQTLHITDCIFEQCTLSNCIIQDASLRRVHFNQCQMIGFSLEQVHLKAVLFEECKLDYFNFA